MCIPIAILRVVELCGRMFFVFQKQISPLIPLFQVLESSFWADSSDTDSTDEGIGKKSPEENIIVVML